MISLSNKTEGKKFTSLMVNVLPDINLFAGGSQNVPELLYDAMGSFSAIRPEVLKKLAGLNQSNIMYYLYGVFHSPQYEKIYGRDLAKSFPRVPNLKNKQGFIQIGCRLAELHLNYENQPIWEGVEVEISKPDYRVKKMKHPKKGILDTIIFNDSITIKNIPEKAYEYIVNGRSAIEWIIDQYQVKTDRKSGITDDPNEFSDDSKYILNLLLSVITVSMRTLELIDELPEFEVQE